MANLAGNSSRHVAASLMRRVSSATTAASSTAILQDNPLTSSNPSHATGTVWSSPMNLLDNAIQRRFKLKPKRAPKSSARYSTEVQKHRTKWEQERSKIFAEKLRGYIEWSSRKRVVPWDSRFKPFDRDEKDGVYHLNKHFMLDKLDLVKYHALPTKKLYCNLGLLGPQVTTKARWKPGNVAKLRRGATSLADEFTAAREGNIHRFADKK